MASQYRWQIRPETPAKRDQLARDLRVRPITAQLLVNRGIETLQEGRDVLSPSLKTLPDPTRLPDFDAAIAALQRVIESKGECPVLIHGDYDVDGTCGSVLLYRLLKMLGVEVSIFLPDRVRDGYSFGENSLKAIHDSKSRLVIAVDNGTTAVEPLRQLAEAGIEVLVVDHHLAGAELPPCTALLNPWVGADADDPIFPYFCGTGVAYLLAWGLLRHLHGDGQLPEHHRRFLFDALGFVAIATLADAMQLKGPNRPLVRRGLETLPTSSFVGLQALCKVLSLKNPSPSDVAYRIAPHLNAAGRMGRTEIAFDLLAATDPNQARKLAESLRDLNRERQDVQAAEQLALEAQVEIQRERGDQVLFAGRSDAVFGVLGIVAARFHETSGLPTLLWAECSPGIARGSARGPEGVNLVELMDAAAPFFHGYGGHAQAAGFHFDPARADELGAALRAAANKLPPAPPPTLTIDCEVQPQEITLPTLDEFNLLEPFGQGFVTPLFCATDLKLCAPVQFMGADGRHVALRLEKNGVTVRVLAWSMADRLSHLQVGDQLDVVFESMVNHFRGRRNAEWTLRDVRSSSTAATTLATP
jgi:single-stranded-DNA-specific exonuclease